jgi:spermidine synthase
MYHVIGTGLTVLFLYLLSYFLYRQNFYSKQFHKEFWNIILAAAFILTALAGLFLALQINYKWNIPVIKSILKWHVEFGIGLSVSGFIHFFWHLSYFKNIFQKDEKGAEPVIQNESNRAGISVNLFITGFISSSVQLLMLKEIMNISGGYELIAGTFLGSWLIGSAAGSAMAARSRISALRKINLVFMVSPLISLIMMLLLARLFLKPGETPSFLAGIIYTFLVLIPFCFVSGFTFVKLIAIAGSSEKFIPGKSFSIETTGGMAAGILISVLSAGHLATYSTLLLIIVLGIAYAVLTFVLTGRNGKLIFRISVLAIAIPLIIANPDLFFRQLLLRGVNVTESLDTRYGNITIAEYGGEKSMYYNQRLLSYSDDAVESEEDIHYAMLQADKPESVLLISGPVNSHVKEIIKYPVKRIVYVERDPQLAGAEKIKPVNGAVELVIENDDAFSFVKTTSEKFNVAIVLLPPPSSLLLNRYYTGEFFSRIKEILSPGGIFACSPGTNPNYFNKESVNLYSSIYNSLRSVFRNVIPFGGNKLYFVASDNEITTSVCQHVIEKNIPNVYVGPDYLSDDLIKAKSDEIVTLMDEEVNINRSAVPIASFYYQAYNLSKSTNEKVPAMILLAILFLFPVLAVKRADIVMYFSASALAGYEIILLLVLQLTAGNMYQLTGLVIAAIMAGLAAGSGVRIGVPARNSLLIKAILLIALYILTGITVDGILSLNGKAVIILLLISGFFPAMITGAIFREMTLNPYDISTTSSVYNADLSGSALGFFIFSGLIIPVLGIRSSLFLLPVMIVAGFLIASVRIKR